MSREALAFVLGRAALDDAFLERLKKDPKSAAEEMKMELSPDERDKVRRMDFDALKQFNKASLDRKLFEPFSPFVTFMPFKYP